MTPIIRAFVAKIDDVSDGERSVVAKVNTDAVDRYKTVIDPTGIDLAAYRKNPVVLWCHGFDPVRGRKPVARSAWIKLDRPTRSLVAKSIFLEDDFADGIFRLYQQQALRSFSVNVIPDAPRCSPPSAAEVRARPELAECQLVYRRSELAEYSAVDVPGNAEALALAVARGLWVPEAARPAVLPPLPPPAPELPPLAGRTFGQAHAELVRALRGVAAAGAARDALDVMRGRV